MNYCRNEVFTESIMHVTVQPLAYINFWCSIGNIRSITVLNSMLTPFVGLHSTTNELLHKWDFYWTYHTCHCTTFGIGKLLKWHWPHQPHLLDGWLACQPHLYVCKLQQMNYCLNKAFGESIIHVTVFILALGNFLRPHQPHILGCLLACQPHVIGLHTTTNAILHCSP